MSPSLYLDCCAWQRPFDDPAQMRIALESEAVLQVVERVETGRLRLIASQALELEVQAMRPGSRRTYCEVLIAQASGHVAVTDAIRELARGYEMEGIKSIDALHLACAVEAKADYFGTCDDRFRRRAQAVQTRLTRVCDVLELIQIIES